MQDYIRYKCLLEYFVTHLEHIQKDSDDVPGYNKYINPIKNRFIRSGLGYMGQSIQNQISEWANYGDHVICINISCSFGSYMTTQCYLNWKDTWLNTRPEWDKSAQKITGLYLSKQEKASAKSELSFSLSELGLFDDLAPNENLKLFFDTFKQLILKKESKQIMQTYTKLLIENKNLILTGAPGTGKTYLAQKIAEELGATKSNGQCMMVQFHPSYDYTDFVEGLRPIQKEGENNIGFELKRGVFKQFCAEALENLIDSKKNPKEKNFDALFKNAYESFIDEIRNEEIVEIPLKTDSTSMEIVDVSDNNNIILQAKGTKTGKRYTVSYNRLKKLSLAYKDTEALDSISNIYKAVRDAIKGCNTSAYWATLYYLYKNHMQNKDIESTVVEQKNYVFIIDEINRGEISKIFGELFFSIDSGYRGENGKVLTQYQNLVEAGDIFEDGFYVPENVYLIGTMNDIDRSVESMDFAMRRRFVWIDIKATDCIEMLNILGENKDTAVKKLINLNKVIEQTEGLNSSYHIGPAYFRKAELYKDTPDTMWSDLWNYHIKGLLNEYIRGTEEVSKKMEEFEKAYNLK